MMMMMTKIMCTSENMVQIKNGAEWTFYASCPSEETKNTERRPRERLLKEYCKLQPLTHITNVNRLCFTGNTMGEEGHSSNLQTMVLVFIFYHFREQ